MKNILKLTLLSAFALLAGPALAAGSHSTPCYFDGKTFNVDSGCTLNVKSGGTLALAAGATESNSATKTSGGTTDVSGISFAGANGAYNANPLIQMAVVDLPIASVNANGGVAIIASAAGKKIYPGGGITVYASGTMVSATSIAIACSNTDKIMTIPIAQLVDHVPVGLYASQSAANLNVLASNLLTGCPAGAGVIASTIGPNAGVTTDLFVSFPYTVQASR